MSLVPTYTDSESESSSDYEESFTKIRSKSESFQTNSRFGLDGEASESKPEDNPTLSVRLPLPIKSPAIPSAFVTLINPFRVSEDAKSKVGKSIFDNKFSDAESSELQKLQKHVKLAPRHEDLKTLNGRKICWSFRKGRCKFGMKCKYAHFTDLVSGECDNKMDAPLSWVPPDSEPVSEIHHEQFDQSAIIEEESTVQKRKKRPGLSEGLVPSKKAMKMYFKTKSQVKTNKPK